MKRRLTTRSLSLAPSPLPMLSRLPLQPTTKETPLILNSSIDDRRDDDERRSRVNTSPDNQSSRRSTSTRRSRSPSTQRSATPQKSSSTRRSSSSEHSSENSSPERRRPTAPPSPKRPRSRQSTPGSPEPKRRHPSPLENNRVIYPMDYVTRKARNDCAFCGRNHYSDNCGKVVDPMDREVALQRSGRCRKCLTLPQYNCGPKCGREFTSGKEDSNNGEDSDNGEGSDNSKDSDPEEESGDEESEQAPDYKEDNESIQPIEIEVEVLFGEDDGSNPQEEEEEDIAIVIPPPEAERCSKMRMLAKYPKEDMTKGCVFCGDGHFADRCPVFPTAEARRQFLNNQDYCKRCLHRRGTGIHSCNDKRKCYYCHSSSHNSAVCSIPKSLTDHRQLRSSGYSRGGRQPSPDVKILEYPDPGEQYEHLQRKRDNRDNMDIRRGYNQDRRTKEDKDQRHQDHRDRHPTEDKDQSYQSGEPSAKRRGQ
ncbi:hypothetical protein L5515_000300 [Caenorhabditis briggsae]|uniref:Uncharacterized protein n=1 Tax=Caenorhabditis briggsae TaxID=6238 RepID=A0AAE9DZB1_CAEBR|nr:hypothetical protein L5515_000300 [Caenorhabditis briggsae]